MPNVLAAQPNVHCTLCWILLIRSQKNNEAKMQNPLKYAGVPPNLPTDLGR